LVGIYVSFVHCAVVLLGTVPTYLHYKPDAVRAFTVQRIRFYDIIIFIIIIIGGGVNRSAASCLDIITSRHERDNFERKSPAPPRVYEDRFFEHVRSRFPV